MTLPGLAAVWSALAGASAQPEAPGSFTGIPPGPLAEPLHFPHPGLARWPVLALLALAALWALYRRWQRRRPRVTAAAAPPAAPTPPRLPAGPRAPKASTLGQRLYALQQRILATRAYRDGCHELAGLLKGHFESKGLGSGKRLRYTRMTAREVLRTTGHRAASELLVQLSDLRFGRDEPTRGEFRQLCRRAQKVTGQKTRKRRLVTGSESHD
jgi:hypothetical protein